MDEIHAERWLVNFEWVRIHVQYFAALREQRGLSSEMLEIEPQSALVLYQRLKAEHGFTLSANLVKVSINLRFVAMETVLHEADSVVFLPPVAGG